MASSFKNMFMLQSVITNMIMLVYLVFANLIPQQVPCLFILGDSLFDNGNNNELQTQARANYPPYGIDFPSGPTGRFSNGKNMVDVIATLLGFDNYIKPHATATDKDILKGVNYASGSAGIRDETGSQLGDRISMNRQLSHHQATISRIATILGSEEAAAKYINKCIYTVGMGSNDCCVFGTLYNYGARKVAIFGLGQIGCIPFEVANFGTNGSKCVDKINEYVQLFNDQIKVDVDELNREFVDAMFIYVNVTEIQSGASSTPVLNAEEPCCVVSTTAAKGQCAPNKFPCTFRILHQFYDAFHPTEVSNVYVAVEHISQSPHLMPTHSI